MMIEDQAVREQALDPSRSFVVQAPAGSGKTTLLTLRLLALLTTVEQPEQVVAITFTRKAAEEMRARIIAALELAAAPLTSDPFTAQLQRRAQALLAHDGLHGWELRAQPSRLRIMTIDALCQSIVRQAPLSAGLVSAQQIDEDAHDLYRDAARAALLALGDNDGRWQAPLARLLRHFDNDWDRLERLLAEMLGCRDQWLPVLGQQADRAVLEAAFARLVASTLAPLRAALAQPAWAQLLPLAAAAGEWLAEYASDSALAQLAGLQALPRAGLADLPVWHSLLGLLLTAEGKWRKRIDKNLGFPPGPAHAARKQAFSDLLDALRAEESLLPLLQHVAQLPLQLFTANEAEVVDALIAVLKLACAELQVQSAHSGRVDFTAYALAALTALGAADDPSELALRLDYRLHHLLVDEFQDTSLTQYELILRLTAGWSGDDGRTLFLVGDPMQSIYRFRQADVALFTRLLGGATLGSVVLERLALSVNFRAQAGLVEWINTVVPAARSRVSTAAVRYVAQQAIKPALALAWQVHGSLADEPEAEAAAVRRVIEQIQAHDATATIAILVRSRSHLGRITSDLIAHGHALAAREIKPLANLPSISDLIALTRALIHPADRIAWLALLRAPWCGAALATLALFGDNALTVWEALQDNTLIARVPSADRARLLAVAAVVVPALARVGTAPLSLVVEHTWIALGGPAGLVSANQAADVRTFFAALTRLEQSEQALTAERLQEDLATRFSTAPPSAQATIQVMTIHRAKGLEFDYVLIPGCGRAARHEGKPLLHWRDELDANGQRNLLLAPSPGKDRSPLYEYLHQHQRDAAASEAVRLLYVALTRGRREVHLFGHATLTADGTMQAQARSFFALMWPDIEPAFTRDDSPAKTQVDEVDNERPPPLRRYACSMTQAMPSVSTPASGIPPLEFDWAGTTAKHIGTVAHRLLQARAAAAGPSAWSPALAAFARGQLRALGVAPDELVTAVAQIELAFDRSANSVRGRWLFSPSFTAVETELCLGVIEHGQTARVIIDRTFVDDDGRRWIVDFKTGSHSGSELEAYLASEVTRYRPQLERYGRIMASLDARPIMLGLFFPLLDAWREWPLTRARGTDGQ